MCVVSVIRFMRATVPSRAETKAEFLARLKKCAKSLPPGFVAKQIGRMKEQVAGVVEAKGYHAKRD